MLRKHGFFKPIVFATCSHPAISQCQGGDGCCPAGWTSGTDKDCSATCGNTVVDPGETCDGN